MLSLHTHTIIHDDEEDDDDDETMKKKGLKEPGLG